MEELERDEESLDHDVRQQMERIPMIGGDRKGFMPLMKIVANVARATDTVDRFVVQ